MDKQEKAKAVVRSLRWPHLEPNQQRAMEMLLDEDKKFGEVYAETGWLPKISFKEKPNWNVSFIEQQRKRLYDA